MRDNSPARNFIAVRVVFFIFLRDRRRYSQQKKSDDFVLATGKSFSIKNFVSEACKVAGISTSKIISSKENYRPYDVEFLEGDYSKAKKKLGWKPKTKFKDLQNNHEQPKRH